MKNILYYILPLSICFLLSSSDVKAQKAYTIFDKDGKEASFEDLLKQTNGKSHLFFGEFHTNPISHWLQFELTKALFQKHNSNLVIGAEMFESDTQLLIDEYFADLIKQKGFEEEARLWKNYKTDYKPILEYAKKNHIPFIATNIPRRYANTVFYNGLNILKELSSKAKGFIAPLPIIPDTTLASYKEIKKMGEGHNGQYMMEAQAVKDATMAHFIAQNSSKNTVFLHLNGSYHSNSYEGIIPFLMAKVERKNIFTITTVSQSQVDKLDEENLNLADFIICVNDDMTNTQRD